MKMDDEVSIHKVHGAIYRDPLFALVTVDLVNQAMSIEGGKTKFVGPSPWEQGASREELDGPTLKPRISNWRVPT